jgi:hypothetical protein
MWFEVDQLYLRFYTNFGEFYSIDKVPINEWCNVALTFDSVTFKIYMNGLLQNELDIDMSEVEGGKLHIGSIGSGETSMYMFNGNMDISVYGTGPLLKRNYQISEQENFAEQAGFGCLLRL